MLASKFICDNAYLTSRGVLWIRVCSPFGRSIRWSGRCAPTWSGRSILRHYGIFNLASSLISPDQARIHRQYSLSQHRQYPVTLRDFQYHFQLDFTRQGPSTNGTPSANALRHYGIFNLASSLISPDQAHIHRRYSLSQHCQYPATLRDFQSHIQLDFARQGPSLDGTSSANTLRHYRIFNLASSLISLDQARIHTVLPLGRRPATLRDFQSRVQLDFPGPRSYPPTVLPQPTPAPFSQQATGNNTNSSNCFSIPAFAEDVTWIRPWSPWDTGIVLILNYSYHICILRINGNSLIYTCYTLYWG